MVLNYLIVLIFLGSNLALAQGSLSLNELKVRFEIEKKSFAKNPSLSHANLIERNLSNLNNQTSFIAKNPNDPFSKEFRDFHLKMVQLQKSHDWLKSCAKGDNRLHQKIRSLSDVLALSSLKDNTKCRDCEQDYREAISAIDSYSNCPVPHQGYIITKEERDLFKLSKALNEKYAPQRVDNTAVHRVYPEEIRREEQKRFDDNEKIIKANGDLENATIEDYVAKKYGFDVLSRKNKTKATNQARDLHLMLMKENRTMTMRDYVRFTQKFDFSDADEIKDPTDKTNYLGDASRLFDAKDFKGYSTLPQENQPIPGKSGYENERERLSRIANEELAIIRKETNNHRLTLDEVYQKVAPLIAEIADPKPKNKQQVAELSRKIEKSEFSFLINTHVFVKDAPKMRQGPSAIKSLLKEALKENITNNASYANWIRHNQNTSNIYGERDAESFAKLGATFLYSSPNSIKNVISAHPDLMGSLCLPMKEVVEEANTELPEWIYWAGGSGSSLGLVGMLAGLSAGSVAIGTYHQDKMDDLNQKHQYAGLGDGIYEKNWEEYRLDKADLRNKVKAHEDAILKDMAVLAVAEVGGEVAGKVVSKSARVITSKIRTARAASKVIEDLGIPEQVSTTIVKDMTVMTKSLQKDLGRELSQDEVANFYKAKLIKDEGNIYASASYLKEMGVREADIKVFIKDQDDVLKKICQEKGLTGKYNDLVLAQKRLMDPDLDRAIFEKQLTQRYGAKKFTPDQVDKIYVAHRVGTKNIKTPQDLVNRMLANPNSQFGLDGSIYSLSEIKAKREILTKAGIKDNEAKLLLKNGDAGLTQTPTEIEALVKSVNYNHIPKEVIEMSKAGKLIKSSADIEHLEDGPYLFLIDSKGNMVISPRFPDLNPASEEVLVKHPALREILNQEVGKNDIVSAGEFYIDSGVLTQINNKSGRFRNGQANLDFGVRIFKDKGFVVTEKTDIREMTKYLAELEKGNIGKDPLHHKEEQVANFILTNMKGHPERKVQFEEMQSSFKKAYTKFGDKSKPGVIPSDIVVQAYMNTTNPIYKDRAMMAIQYLTNVNQKEESRYFFGYIPLYNNGKTDEDRRIVNEMLKNFAERGSFD